MDYVAIVAGLVKLATALAGWLHDRHEFNEGQDAAVAKAAVELLKQTATGKKLFEQIQSLPDPDLDKLLSDLAAS